MNHDLIKSATKKLELVNIVLHEAHLARNEEIDPFSPLPEYKQQSMLAINSEDVTYTTKDEKNIDILRSYVNCGIRVLDKDSDDTEEIDDQTIFFIIEATFRVDYLVKKKLTKAEAHEFSQFNSVHNIWPFWRHYVLETTRTADLPHIVIPLMRGIPNDDETNKEKKNTKTG